MEFTGNLVPIAFQCLLADHEDFLFLVVSRIGIPTQMFVRRSSARLDGGGADSFPDLQAMNGNLRIDLEPELHFLAADLEHLYFEQALEAASPSDHDRLLAFSRQH
jgi:hypothetical protein